MRLDLSHNERYALQSALDNYLNGLGMEQDDEDETVLENLLAALAAGES